MMRKLWLAVSIAVAIAVCDTAYDLVRQPPMLVRPHDPIVNSPLGELRGSITILVDEAEPPRELYGYGADGRFYQWT